MSLCTVNKVSEVACLRKKQLNIFTHSIPIDSYMTNLGFHNYSTYQSHPKVFMLLWKERENTVEGLWASHQALSTSRFHWEGAGAMTRGPLGSTLTENITGKRTKPSPGTVLKEVLYAHQ